VDKLQIPCAKNTQHGMSPPANPRLAAPRGPPQRSAQRQEVSATRIATPQRARKIRGLNLSNRVSGPRQIQGEKNLGRFESGQLFLARRGA
jgi:hypothetical protein